MKCAPSHSRTGTISGNRNEAHRRSADDCRNAARTRPLDWEARIVAQEYPPITTLIPNLLQGDEESWNALVELFSPAITGKAHVLLRNSPLRRHLEPEDLVSETFAKAWKHHALIRGKSTYQIAKWLLTILTNAFRDHCRKGGLPEEAQPDWQLPVAASSEPGSHLDAFEMEVKLHAAMAELPAEDRNILVQKYWYDQTHEQIAQKIGTSKASVTRRIQKLLPELQRMLHD